MKTLKEHTELATGDPEFCTSCGAIFNMFSKLEDGKEQGIDGQIWNCEFCQKKNEVHFLSQLRC